MALSGWNTYQKIPITIAAVDVPSNQVNFPVLLNISDNSGIGGANLSAVFSAIGSNSLKIAVEDGDSGNQCYVEIEKWDNANESAQIWVKVPVLSSSSDTVLYFYYDATRADNTTYVGAIGSTPGQSVWSNDYLHVYHLSQIPSGAGSILDSVSSGAINGSSVNMDSSDLVPAFIGSGLEMNGIDEKISFTFSSNITTATVELSIKATTGTPDAYDGIFAAESDIGSVVMSFIVNAAAGGVSFYRNNTGESSILSVADFSSWNHFSYHIAPNSEKITNHTSDTSNAVASIVNRYISASSSLSRWYNDSRRFPGVMRGLFISSIVRSDDWLELSYKSKTDNLINYGFAGNTVVVALLDQSYGDASFFRAVVEQIYGLRILVAVSQRYGDVPAVRALLDQYYASAAILRRKLDQPYGDALALRQLVEQLWTLPADLRSRLEQNYAISGEALRRLLAENYHINEYNQLRRQLEQIYLLAPSDATVQQPTISVTAAGVELSPHHINIEIDENDFAIRGEIHLADQADYLLCLHLQTTLAIVIDSDTYTVLVEAPRQSRPEVGREEYIVPFASPAILLDAPYAATITRDFAGAMVSAIVAEMAGLAGVSVSYACTDWYLPSTSLYANNETPLAIIRKLVAAVGGILQSAPDGTLICRPEYPQTVPTWENSAPAYYLTDMDNYFSVDSSPALRQGYNRFLIADKNLGETGLTMEQRDINATTKDILVYRVPWSDLVAIHLETSGGAWVSIIDEGVQTETITEQVEIVAGVGRVAKPIYTKTALDYKEANLGTITAAEDGSLQTEIVANSLVDITYVTKYHLFRVSDPRLEDVQFYPVEVTL